MKDVALVISSGGARGLAAIGVIEELEARGYNITSIAGSSIGSAIGGIYASGCLEQYKEWICSLEKMDVLKLMDFTISRNGFLKGVKVFREMSQFFKDRNIEDLSIPYAAVSVDLITHQQVVFKKGSLYAAIRASCSIPSLIQPSNIQGKVLIDGGVINPLPFSEVARKEEDILIGVDLNAFDSTPKKEESYWDSGILKKINSYLNLWEDRSSKVIKPKVGGSVDIASKSFQIMQEQLTALSVKEYQPEMLIKIPRTTSSTFEFFRAAELIDLGRDAIVKKIEKKSNIPV